MKKSVNLNYVWICGHCKYEYKENEIPPCKNCKVCEICHRQIVEGDNEIVLEDINKCICRFVKICSNTMND